MLMLPLAFVGGLQLPHQQQPKICADCKFFNLNKKECVIFAEVSGDYEKAIDVRKDDEKCGKEAIFFEKNDWSASFAFLSEYGKTIVFLSITTLFPSFALLALLYQSMK